MQRYDLAKVVCRLVDCHFVSLLLTRARFFSLIPVSLHTSQELAEAPRWGDPTSVTTCNRRPFSRFRFSVFFNSISGSQSPIEYKAENCNEREIRKLIINQNGVEFLPPRRRVFMDHSAYFKSNLRNSPSQCSRSQRARAPHTEKVDRTLRSRSSLGRRIKN